MLKEMTPAYVALMSTFWFHEKLAELKLCCDGLKASLKLRQILSSCFPLQSLI